MNSVNPTVTWTDMAAFAWSDPAKSGPMLAKIPMGKFVGKNVFISVNQYLFTVKTSFGTPIFLKYIYFLPLCLYVKQSTMGIQAIFLRTCNYLKNFGAS